MAHVLYGVMLTSTEKVEEVRRYLYGDTEIVAAAPVAQDGDTSFAAASRVYLVFRTEARDAVRTAHAQQQQADRLASGMHYLVTGLETRQEAEEEAGARAMAHDLYLGTFAPFVLSAVSA